MVLIHVFDAKYRYVLYKSHQIAENATKYGNKNENLHILYH